MAKNSRMALYCQNQVSKGTSWRYGLHSSASISGHSASITVLGLLKEEKKEENKKEFVQNGNLCFAKSNVHAHKIQNGGK